MRAPAVSHVATERFTLPAFAKINLTLRVLGRRADGYHELHTVFQTITLQDRLSFEPATDDRLELVCAEPGIPLDESNLVWRAWAALRERFGLRRGARIQLEKMIPAGGGLGGGSADAAVTLLGLSRLWRLDAEATELASVGARLGADVPFFFVGGTALGTGTGTQVAPLEDLPRAHLLVVAPGVAVSTAEAYKALRAPALTKEVSPVMLPISRAEPRFTESLCEVLRNDFEAVVVGRHPEIGRAREALLRCGARCAMLSGSGSSVFGLFDNAEGVERGREALRREAKWRAYACATLAREEYWKALGMRAAVS